MSGCGICRTRYPGIDPETDDFCYECRHGAAEELCVRGGKMDICAYCGEGLIEKGHEYCRVCERDAARIERQLTLAVFCSSRGGM